ncbi:class I SAM-dependent methyltransferase [Kribbella sp. NPDC050470]|uniref:class I SAM-dependent methyltransferase n=1 Tax=unclassified Kribbella TaxID=2644121 RepID=UPI0037BDB068
MTDRLSRIARGWDQAADGYEAYFVPRFAPWVAAAVEALETLPDGPILVPCCGTFPEAELLLERFPGRELAGIDLSAGMVERARERLGPRVTVVQGDANILDARWSGACAGVVSAFGLQQLPDPEAAIRSWTDALRPGGRLSVVYWPENTEDDGPFAAVAKAIGERSDYSWEDRLLDGLDAVVERDEFVAYPMTHPDAATYFDTSNHGGSMRALALARGDDYIAQLRQRYLEQAPAGEWTHHPRARLIVVRKPPSRAAAAPPTS